MFERPGESVDGGLAHLLPIDAATAEDLLARVIRFDLAHEAELTDQATAARIASCVGSAPTTARLMDERAARP